MPEVEHTVPSVSFCRGPRRVLRIVAETLAAYRAGLAKRWRQLVTDGTSRRQLTLSTSSILAEFDNEPPEWITMRAAFVVEGGTAEQELAGIRDKVLPAAPHLLAPCCLLACSRHSSSTSKCGAGVCIMIMSLPVMSRLTAYCLELP